MINVALIKVELLQLHLLEMLLLALQLLCGAPLVIFRFQLLNHSLLILRLAQELEDILVT